MDNNFDKHIRDTMNDPPELPFDEQLWKKMESRLDDDGKPRRTFALPWWPFALLSAVAGLSAVYFYWQLQHLRHDYLPLDGRQVVVVDTLVQRQVTIVYDTIYQTVQATRQEATPLTMPTATYSLSANDPATQTSQPPTYRFELGPAIQRLKAASLTNESISLTSLAFAQYQDQPPNTQQQAAAPRTDVSNGALNSLALAQLKAIDLSLVYPTGLEEYTFAPIRNRRKALARLLPNGFSLSGNVGTLFHFNFLGDSENFLGGLSTGVHFGNRFRLLVGAESLWLNFKSEVDEESQQIEFPDLAPKDPQDVLTEVDGRFRYLQIPFGLQYRLPLPWKVRTHLGLGLIAQRNNYGELEYEFAGNREEYKISQPFTIGEELRIDDGWLSLELERPFANHWSLYGTLHGQIRLKAKTDFEELRPQGIGLKLGIRYSL
ncbi:MAG: hypothetical protein AAFO94_12000 [Bacteroidota bacterium]